MNYYECKHFNIRELVSPYIYKKRGNKSWELFDNRLLHLIDDLREYYYKHYNALMIINSWSWRGNRSQSGFRTSDCPKYSDTSQHAHGRAADYLLIDRITKKRINTQLIRDEIIIKQKQFPFNNIGCLEDFKSMTWVHVDVRQNKTNKLKVVSG